MAALHVVRGTNRYCGPAALALLTGLTTDEASALLREVGGRPAIKGTYHMEMADALRRLFGRVDALYRPDHARPTLRQFVRALTPGRYVVVVTGHYVVAHVSEGRRVTVGDSHTRGPARLRGFHAVRKQVRRAWRVAEPKAAAVHVRRARRQSAWAELWRAVKALGVPAQLRDDGFESEVLLPAGHVFRDTGTHAVLAGGETRAERARYLLCDIAGGVEPCGCEECEAGKAAEGAA